MKYVYKKKSLKVFAYILDIAGSVIFYPVKFIRPDNEIKTGRILLIRCDHIGDVVLSGPAIHELHKKFPESQIDVITSEVSKPILDKDPSIKNVLCFSPPWFSRKKTSIIKTIKAVREMIKLIRNGKYDVVVDFRGDLRHIFAMFMSGVKTRISYGITGGGFLLSHCMPYEGVVYEAERNMDLLNVLGINKKRVELDLVFPREEFNMIEKLLKDSGINENYSVFHFSPGHESKKWNIEKFSKVIEHVYRSFDSIPVLVGSADDKETALMIKKEIPDIPIFDFTGKTSLGELFYLISTASLFVGLDSAPAHFAVSSKVPGVILFSGVNDPRQWFPETGDNLKILYPGEGRDLSVLTEEMVNEAIDHLVEGKKGIK